MKKNVMKTMVAAVCVVAAGMGGMKAYNAANQSEADMLLAENVEALSAGDGRPSTWEQIVEKLRTGQSVTEFTLEVVTETGFCYCRPEKKMFVPGLGYIDDYRVLSYDMYIKTETRRFTSVASAMKERVEEAHDCDETKIPKGYVKLDM